MQLLNEREKRIIEHMVLGTLPTQQDLSKEFNVSINTIRNDFKSLEEKGVAITIRGGVIPAFHPELFRRMNSNIETKEKIAQKAADFIKDYDSVSISCGSTCALIGRYLFGKLGINLITHSTLFLPYARTNPNINLHLLGGEFLPEEDATAGMTTLQELDTFYPRLAIVGSDNFSIESGITSRSKKAAEVISKILQHAEYKILVVESRKFGSGRYVQICSLDEVDLIITDSKLSLEAQQLFQEKNVKFILAD